MDRAVLLLGHGTVERLDDLTPFVTNVRRGHPPPEELVTELRRRYEAIGGRSPLLDHSRALAAAMERELGVPVRVAMRLWEPYPRGVLEELAATGVRRVAVIPLAQHSANIYADAARAAAKEIAVAGGPTLEMACASNWGQAPRLLDAYADTIRETLAHVPADARKTTTVLMTAHSLPQAVIASGDPYEREVRASADAIAARLGSGAAGEMAVAFQSQGMSQGPGGRPMPWLGPTLEEALDRAKAAHRTHVVFAPIGFLADHVEILYDLDIEAAGWAKARGLVPLRTPALNARESLVLTLAEIARPLLDGAGAAQVAS